MFVEKVSGRLKEFASYELVFVEKVFGRLKGLS